MDRQADGCSGSGRKLAAASDAPTRAAAAELPAPARLLLTNEFGLIALIAIFGAIFALGTPGFGSQFNLFTLGRTTAIDIMIGFSMMVVIVTGGLNLSVGAIGVCAAMAMGWLLQRAGLPLAARDRRRRSRSAARSAPSTAR